MKQMRGMGRVWQPTYRDKKTGAVKTSAVWWLQWSVNGTVYRESAETTVRRVAVDRLKAKHDPDHETPIAARTQATVGACAEDFLRDYRVRDLRSLDTARHRVAPLLDFFGADTKARTVTTAWIRRYQQHRKDAGAAGATINRETSALRRMLALAVESQTLTRCPPFPARLDENPPRQGFFEHPEYLAVRAHLPPDYADVLDFGYSSGWRLREITGLTWSEVHGGEIRLAPARSKSKTGRVLPLSPPLRSVLTRRREARRLDTPHVFHRGGQPVGDWRKTWSRACEAAGVPGKLFHDLRRTVVRNLTRSGVPESVAMRMTGHKTRSVFLRYDVVNDEDLRQAADRLASYTAAQPATAAGRK